MAVYAYDGSFEGLLTAYRRALDAADPAPGFENEAAAGTGWLFDTCAAGTCPETALDLAETVRSLGGRSTWRLLAYAYLSEITGFEPLLFEFVRLTLHERRSIAAWRHHDTVRQVQLWAHKVSHEAHRFSGLLRFMKLRDGVLYGPYEPDHNITVLLARHFKSRMPQQRWVIHDRGRGVAIAWDGHHLAEVAGAPDNVDELLAPEERETQRLWRLFAETVSIKTRTNPRLQQRCMPRRYWRYLPEMTAK